jgi:uncharacterized phage infection (PIP) family protein YhgE
MVSLPLGTLTLDLVANIQRLTAGLDRAQAQMTQFQDKISTAASAFTKFGAAYLTFQTLSTAINTVISSLDRLGSLGEIGEQIGATAEQLQALRGLAVGAGIEPQQMEQAFGKLSTAIGEAAAGSEQAQQKFERLGVSFRTATGEVRDSWSVFIDVAHRAAEAGTATEALRIAAEAFGERGGRRMVPLLQEIANQSGNLRQRLIEAGLILGDDLVKASDDAGDAIARLGLVITNMFDSTLANLAPWIQKMSEGLESAFRDFGQRARILPVPIESQQDTAQFWLQRELDNVAAYDRQIAALQERLAQLSNQYREMQDAGRTGLFGGTAQIRDTENRITAITQELVELFNKADLSTAKIRELMLEVGRLSSARIPDFQTTPGAEPEGPSDTGGPSRVLQDLRAQAVEAEREARESVSATLQALRSDMSARESAARSRRQSGESEAQKRLNEQQREFNELLREMETLYKAARSPAEEYSATLGRVSEAISKRAFAPDMEGVRNSFAAAGKASADYLQSVLQAGDAPGSAMDTIRERLAQLRDQWVSAGVSAEEAGARMEGGLQAAMRPFEDVARRVFESTREPMEEFRKAAQEINDAFAAGAFTAQLGGGETAMRGLAEAAGQAAAAVDQIGGNTGPIVEEFRQRITELGQEMIRTGELAEENFPQFIERAMRKASEAMQNSPYQLQVRAIRQATDTIMRDIEDAFLDMSGNVMDTVNNLLESILKTFQRLAFRTFIEPALQNLLNIGMKALMSGFAPSVGGGFKSAHGNIFANHNVVPFAQGGVVSSPSLFSFGSIAEAGRPEMIAPLFRDSAGDLGVKARVDAAPVVVNIYNNGDNQVRTETRDGANGREIDVYIERAVDRGLVEGRFDRSLGTSFGLRRSGVR